MIGTPCCLVRSSHVESEIPKEVLIVEDQALVRMMAADALVDHDFMAWEAGSADEALDTLNEHRAIGLLFTDVDMPGDMDGLELARQVDAERPNVELVITSGAVTLAEEDLPDHGTFLPKPYPPHRLVQIVSAKFEGDE